LIIFELCYQVIDFSDEKSIFSVSITSYDKVSFVPDTSYLVNLFQDSSLSCCKGRDNFTLFEVSINTLLKKSLESKVKEGSRLLTINELPDLYPMLFLHMLVTKGSNQITMLSNITNFGCGSLKYFITILVFLLELSKFS